MKLVQAIKRVRLGGRYPRALQDFQKKRRPPVNRQPSWGDKLTRSTCAPQMCCWAEHYYLEQGFVWVLCRFVGFHQGPSRRAGNKKGRRENPSAFNVVEL